MSERTTIPENKDSRYRLRVITTDLGVQYFNPQWKDDGGTWCDYVWDPVRDPTPITFVHKEDALAYLLKRKQEDEDAKKNPTATETYIYV
jgi:hypothetical protein